jgi:transcriptional regulator with XRE-family HTH domain
MPAQGEWSADLTRSIAKNMRRCRKAKRWSARELSETCDILGFPVPRTTISDLENGRRLFLSVAELLILARALEVSPAELVFPQDQDEYVWVSPEEPALSVKAAKWWGGSGKLAGVSRDGVSSYIQRHGDDLESLFDQHERLVAVIRYCHRCVKGAQTPDAVLEARLALGAQVLNLDRLCRNIHAAGFVPPDLPDDLALLAAGLQ